MRIASTARSTLKVKPAPKPPRPEGAATDLYNPGMIIAGGLTDRSSGNHHLVRTGPQTFNYFERNHAELAAVRKVTRFAAKMAHPHIKMLVDGVWFVVDAAAVIEPLTRDVPSYEAATVSALQFVKNQCVGPLSEKIVPGETWLPYVANKGLGIVIKAAGKEYYGDLRKPLAGVVSNPFPDYIDRKLQPGLKAASDTFSAANSLFALIARGTASEPALAHSFPGPPVTRLLPHGRQSLWPGHGAENWTPLAGVDRVIKMSHDRPRRHVTASPQRTTE